MNYSVLTKVTNDDFNGQQFYLYESSEEGLTVLSKGDGDKLVEILSDYPAVFLKYKLFRERTRKSSY